MVPDDNPYASWERNFVAEMVRLREAKGLTQTELARLLKDHRLAFHQQTVQRIEAGDRPIRLNEAFLIAKVLGARLDSMTAAVPLDERELRHAVDRVRHESENLAWAISGGLGEWYEQVDEFAMAISRRMPGNSHESLPGSVDEGTRWAMAWVAKILAANKATEEAFGHVLRLSGVMGRPHREDDWENALPGTPSIDVMAGWWEQYSSPELVELAATPSSQLYEQRFGGGAAADAAREARRAAVLAGPIPSRFVPAEPFVILGLAERGDLVGLQRIVLDLDDELHMYDGTDRAAIDKQRQLMLDVISRVRDVMEVQAAGPHEPLLPHEIEEAARRDG